MGLAASQARFLCLTARKADCEYKSTVLAQEKLDITNLMSTVAYDYSQAMNATKLMWCPDGMSGDFGLTYSLLMMPSAANDFDPYMVTTPSGAIVLNTAFMEAAKAAGISKTGKTYIPKVLDSEGKLVVDPNKVEDFQIQRDQFISALVAQGVITESTAKAMTKYDYNATLNEDNSVTLTEVIPSDGVSQAWQYDLGMGAEPKIKGGADAMSLSGLILSDKIGQQIVDWAKLFSSSSKPTEDEYNNEIARMTAIMENAASADTFNNDAINETIIQLEMDKKTYIKEKYPNKSEDDLPTTDTYLNALNTLINNVKSYSTLSDNDKKTTRTNVQKQLNADIVAYKNKVSASGGFVKIPDNINTSVNSLKYSSENPTAFSIVVNGVINHYEKELENMTLGDILSQNVVLMANGDGSVNGKKMDAEQFIASAKNLLDQFATILGYNPSSTINNVGLNVDEASAKALKFAYAMVSKIFLNPAQIENIGSRSNDHAMTENSAYVNADTYNRVGMVDCSGTSNDYYAISLTNMMNAFLTYFENGLTGVDSPYVVGKSVETSQLVTDNSAYVYLTNENNEEMKMIEKDAQFYDELFNNLLEHGWRYDSSIDDSEYLETVLKNGRYSMCSLNQDGYYYQTRYNETGYMVEVSDTDAIARAEAEFTAKKAELTYKEDTIDMKMKKLDAEIASVAAEVDSVRNIISKAIEKTFTMFST